MEKLIELLNEYEAKRHKTSVIANIRKGEDRLSYLEMNWNYSELLCISNGYGFIKWLVDNDKIDLEKLDKKSERKPMYSFEEEWKIWFKLFEVYESLLILLAIQENPIEFLCSVLN